MRTRDFLDQAVFLTTQFDVVVRTSRRLPEEALREFWVASRARFDDWGLQLRQGTDQLERASYGVDRLWQRWTPLLEEILLSEIVTRIWAYLLESLDDRMGIQEYAPIGQSAFRAHLDARRRVLNLLLRGRQRGLPTVWRLNRQRMSAERWTDLLLSLTPPHPWLRDYAFESERVQRFAETGEPGGRYHAILRSAGRAAFANSAELCANNADAHTRIHASMLGCFGSELFRDDGQLISGWQARMLALTDDTHGLLADWLDDHTTAEGPTQNPGSTRRLFDG